MSLASHIALLEEIFSAQVEKVGVTVPLTLHADLTDQLLSQSTTI